MWERESAPWLCRGYSDGVDLPTAREQLYRGDPDGFVAARTELVALARRDGDRELAAAIAALGKPTRPAWLVNLLAHERAELVEQLLDLAELLAEAHRTVAGSELRTLTRQRHALIAEIARTAVALGAERGYRAPESAQQQVAQTLDAALADAEVAQQLRDGTITRPASFSGFGPASAPAAPAPAAQSAPRPGIAPVIELDAHRREQQARQARSAATRAREDHRRAESAVERARRRLDELTERVTARAAELETETGRLADADAEVQRLEAELAEARRARDAVAAEHARADDAHATAGDQRDRSADELARAERQLTETRETLDEAEALLARLEDG